jgi:hypothetical protein
MDPYIGMKKRPPSKRADVAAELVVVLSTRREDRGLKLITPHTRAVLRNEIHEFIITDEEDARPTAMVNRVASFCFAEVKKGGVIAWGDKVIVEGRLIGEIVGFDETHMPNHMNVIIRANERKSGFELGVALGQKMIIADKD